MIETERITQTLQIQIELVKASEEFPSTPKNEIITLVLARLELDNTKRPTVRRAKGQLVKEYERFLRQMK